MSRSCGSPDRQPRSRVCSPLPAPHSAPPAAASLLWDADPAPEAVGTQPWCQPGLWWPQGPACPTLTGASPAVGAADFIPQHFRTGKKPPARTRLGLFSEISESFFLKFPPPLPFKNPNQASCLEKTTTPARSGKQGCFWDDFSNATSLDGGKHQIPIPSSTEQLFARHTGLVGQGNNTNPLHPLLQPCQPAQPLSPAGFWSPEPLTMLHCNTLCISNHLFLQFWLSSDAVARGKAGDFTPSSTEFGVALEGGIVGNKQDMGAGLGAQEGGGVMEQRGAESRRGRGQEGGRPRYCSKEGFGSPKRG